MSTFKKSGRPRLPEGRGKMAPLNMRTTQDIREMIERAAHKNGRSMTAEVEDRIVQSFSSDALNEIRAELNLLRRLLKQNKRLA